MFTILADQCVNRDVRNALRSLSNVTLVYTGDVGLATAPDTRIFEYARENGHVLFTSDKGFGNPQDFNLARSAGVVIVYVEDFGRASLVHECKEFFERRTQESLRGKGFIIRPGRVRPFGSD